MQTQKLQHKHGGRIVNISAVGHVLRNGVADWFYVGDVEWSDGGKSENTEIPPYAVCFDQNDKDAQEEHSKIYRKLCDYLGEYGEWHDPKHKKDGRVYHWSPKSKKTVTSLAYL